MLNLVLKGQLVRFLAPRDFLIIAVGALGTRDLVVAEDGAPLYFPLLLNRSVEVTRLHRCCKIRCDFVLFIAFRFFLRFLRFLGRRCFRRGWRVFSTCPIG